MTNKDQLDQAAALLRAGRLVAFPTETVYGLGANALDARAVERIYEAKGRPATSPLIVHVDGVEMAARVVASWPAAAAALAERFWPGPLTLVLPKRPIVPDNVTAGLPTVGVRVPSHPLALELIRRTGLPLAAPSANRFTALSPTTAEHVRQGLGSSVDMIVDGGPCTVGIESTVLSLAGEPAVLLRPGMVSREEIEAVIGPVAQGSAPDAGAHASPGLHEKHYAPRTPLRVGRPVSREGVGAVWHTTEPESEVSIRLSADPAQFAVALYGALHRLDRLGLREIVVEPVPDTAAWDGIRDRLSRAASKS